MGSIRGRERDGESGCMGVFCGEMGRGALPSDVLSGDVERGTLTAAAEFTLGELSESGLTSGTGAGRGDMLSGATAERGDIGGECAADRGGVSAPVLRGAGAGTTLRAPGAGDSERGDISGDVLGTTNWFICGRGDSRGCERGARVEALVPTNTPVTMATAEKGGTGAAAGACDGVGAAAANDGEGAGMFAVVGGVAAGVRVDVCEPLSTTAALTRGDGEVARGGICVVVVGCAAAGMGVDVAAARTEDVCDPLLSPTALTRGDGIRREMAEPPYADELVTSSMASVRGEGIRDSCVLVDAAEVVVAAAAKSVILVFSWKHQPNTTFSYLFYYGM